MIRYPGGKGKLAPVILREMPVLRDGDLFGRRSVSYVEPFVGAGAIARKVVPSLPAGSAVWLNDLDRSVSSLWKAIWKRHEELAFRIDNYRPQVEDFYRFKD